MPNVLVIFTLTLTTAGAVLFAYWKNINVRKELEKQKEKMKVDAEEKEKEMNRRMYELAILKDLGERVGYSLNVQNVADIITGSLHSFIDYSAVSYMLLGSEKIIFKVYLEKSVSRSFVEDVKNRMLKSLSALLDREFKKNQIEEILSGSILVDEIEEPVRSFFNIPLVIGKKVVGVLTVADTKAGLYKEREMTILYKITNQASLAVSRLHEVVETEQKKFSSMVESMSEGVVMTDKEYKIMVVNPAAKRIVGLEQKEEIMIFDFIDNLSGKFDIRGRLEESVKLNKIITVEDVLIRDHFYKIFVSPVKSASGIDGEEILGGVVIFHDITHEKEVERIREEFSSMMVHELRAPLNSTLKVFELLEDGTLKQGEKDYDEMLAMIYKSTSNMLELVNDMLDVAKLEAGKFEIYRESSNIGEIIQERVRFFEFLAKEGKVSLTSCLSSKLPEKLEFDPRKISQVLNNLISNAIKFTKAAGQVTVQAILHTKGKDISEEAKESGIKWFLTNDFKNIDNLGDSLVVAVTDSGIGMAQSDIPKLFDKFKQFHSNMIKEEKKGTGLGLSIAKGIVEAHQGIIGVASEEGMGSTFYFVIPTLPATAAK